MSLATAPKIKLLPGERHREFVLSQQEEGLYLASAPEPLASVASVLAETGLRPEECYRLRWESEDRCRTPCPADDATSQSDPAKPMGERGEA